MTKRYREPVEVDLADAAAATAHPAAAPASATTAPAARGQLDLLAAAEEPPPPVPPAGFTWRGGRYRVLAVLGHWREDAAYWTGGGVEVPQRDLWRVEAQNGTPTRGIYELVAEGPAGGELTWRLDRVWD